MIAKGTPHSDGAILARYLVTGKGGESAALWELRGFACHGIVSAFRSVHVMAAATKCVAPFFHVSVRNRDTERLDKSQWQHAADVIERILGLTDQPRAISFHTASDTGQSHMHVAWSRIDHDTLTTKALPFWKQRLKTACRQLEESFGLKSVPNNRQGTVQFAPTRAENEQARRLGVNIHGVRERIRACFERSDSGNSFQSALASEEFILARGDRRDFVVVDRAGGGGVYALGKRILGVSAAETRLRLADVSPDRLPTLEQARALIAVQQHGTAPGAVTGLQPRPENQFEDNKPRKKKKGRAVGKRDLQGRYRRVCPIPPPAVEPANATSERESPPVNQGLTIAIIESDPPRAAVPEATPKSAPNDAPPEKSCVLEARQADQIAAKHCTNSLRSRVAEALRREFRETVRQLTHKKPAPDPAARRKRREDWRGAFAAAAHSLLRRIFRLPLFERFDLTWEPFTWLHIWEYNGSASTSLYQDGAASPPTSSHAPQI